LILRDETGSHARERHDLKFTPAIRARRAMTMLPAPPPGFCNRAQPGRMAIAAKMLGGI
jgi:hypothetical protein